MKKLFGIILAVCLMVSVLTVTAVTAFAAEETTDKLPDPAADVVLRVKAKDKKTLKEVLIQDYTEFDEGWEGAIDFAKDKKEREKYSRVIVDFYGDWTADEDGVFGDSWRLGSNWGDGFQYSTIYIPEDVNITLNLNGHTIDRDLEESENDGEVIYIDEGADVIINNGTIKGGKSTNGAGGIHVDNAYLTLNNVHIVGNVADVDDGAGIALYDDSTLIMNGGSFKDNVIVSSWTLASLCYGGAIYVNDSKATFENVEFKNNQTEYSSGFGAAIYANDSEVVIKNCTFDGNGIKDEAKDFQTSNSIIHADDSTINIEKSTFTNNGGGYHYDPRYAYSYTMDEYIGFYSSIFTLEDSDIFISGDSKISNNNLYYIFFARGGSSVYATDTTITDNTAMVMWSSEWNENDNYFKNCTFNNNKLTSDKMEIAGGIYDDYNGESFYIGVFENFPAIRVVFENCDMGDSHFEQWVLDYVKFVDCENTPHSTVRHFASIFGEGSLTMIVSITALIASVAAIGVSISSNKKKDDPEKATSEDNE